MKKSLLTLTVLLTISTQTIYSQEILANPKSSSIVAKQTRGSDLLIPIELDIVNPGSDTLTSKIIVEIDNSTAPSTSQFLAGDMPQIKILNNIENITVPAKETKKLPLFYLFIDRGVSLTYEKIVCLKIKNETKELTTIKVTVQADDKVLSLEEYMEEDKKPKNRIHRLDEVTKVESSNNILTINGYRKELTNRGSKEDVFVKKNVQLDRGEVLAVKEKSYVRFSFHWKPLPISLITVPFKVRPKITSGGKEFINSATSGITNIGFNLDLAKRQVDRYFATGKKTSHKWSLGIWVAPSVEELDSVYTHGANGLLGKTGGKMEKSKQLFISTGITISYSYNDISFVFVPMGFDLATSSMGKTWVYDKLRWWGFGIAISPKIFSTILNK